MPLAREVVRDLAVEHGACIRPFQLRRTNLDTGEIEQVLVSLRAAQCREGWHLETEPDIQPDPATEDSNGGWCCAPKHRSPATRPPQPGTTPPTTTSSSPSSMR